MYLSKADILQHELVDVKQSFLKVHIQISDERLIQLLKFQLSICQSLYWVELDSTMLHKIISLFLETGSLYEWNYMLVLKELIQSYYIVRSTFDYHTNDDEILTTLKEEFLKTGDVSLETLPKRVKTYLRKEGGHHYKERFDII